MNFLIDTQGGFGSTMRKNIKVLIQDSLKGRCACICSREMVLRALKTWTYRYFHRRCQWKKPWEQLQYFFPLLQISIFLTHYAVLLSRFNVKYLLRATKKEFHDFHWKFSRTYLFPNVPANIFEDERGEKVKRSE